MIGFGRLIRSTLTEPSTESRRTQVTDWIKKTESGLSASSPDVGKRWEYIKGTVAPQLMMALKVIGGVLGCLFAIWLAMHGQLGIALGIIPIALAFTRRFTAAGIATVLLGLLLLTGWFTELTVGLDHPSRSEHGFYLSGMAGVAFAIVFVSLIRGTLSDKPALVAGLTTIVIGFLMVKLLSSSQDLSGALGTISDSILVLALAVILLTWLAAVVFGTNAALFLGATGAVIFFADWLVFSENAGLKTGYFLDTHFSQLGNGLILVAVGLVLVSRYDPAVVTEPDQEPTTDEE